MNKSAILYIARGMLERKTKDTICEALEGVVKMTPGVAPQVRELLRWIQGMLETHATYEQWLINNHWEFLHQQGFNYHYLMSWEPYRQGRLAWMDWMINIHLQQEAENKPIPF